MLGVGTDADQPENQMKASLLKLLSTAELHRMLERTQRLANPTARDEALCDAISNVLDAREFLKSERN